jgi:hypothetical protein
MKRLILVLFLLLPAAANAGGGIKHVVLCWLNEPGSAEHARRLIDVSLELRAIPGVRSLEAGPPVPGDRPIVDDSFDVGLVMDFAGEEELNTYIDHPEHVARVRETLGPLCRRVLVYDIRYE